MFFAHWSSTETGIVAATQPVPLNPCPFCKQVSDCVIKIYNTKTTHYSTFSIGKGDFYATFTCRNCTMEGGLDPVVEQQYVATYRANVEYKEIEEQHKTKPKKAADKLERLIRKNRGLLFNEQQMRDTLMVWRREIG